MALQNQTKIPRETSPPLLSICIPTYNRGRFVEAQVRTILSNLIDRVDCSIELIVVNNKSTDDTQERLANFKHKNFKLINRQVHYDTAEENIIRSLEFVHGEYVWFLGDDDPICVNNFSDVIARLKAGESDLFVFNSSTIWGGGELESLQPMPMNGASVSGSLGQVIECIGLVNTFAGLSNIIQRRQNLDLKNGVEWLSVSKIYSHVAWFVDSQSKGVATFVNSPLVFYRLNDYSDGHWDRVAQRMGVQDLYFWTLGVVRMIRRLVDRGSLDFRQAGQIFEIALGGDRYRLIDDIVFKTHLQLKAAAETDDKRQQFTGPEFEEIRSFCLSSDATLFSIFELLQDAHRAICRPDSLGLKDIAAERLSVKFMTLYNARQSAGQFIGRFVGIFHGFEVYRMTWNYVGILKGDVETRRHVLKFVDPIGDGVASISAQSIDGIIEAALAARDKRLTAYQSNSNHTVVSTDTSAAFNQVLAHSNALQAQITEIHNSTSWVITAPLRKIGRLFKRGRA